MPLLVSPIDGSPMKQVNRYGIEIDVCPTTGGIWLDKGELEKLMAIMKEECADENLGQYRQQRKENRERQYYKDDDDNDKHYKRKSKMSRMIDIFDF